MAIWFDDDPVGAILEYGVLHRSKNQADRHGWEKANLRHEPAQSPWLGYGMHAYVLTEALGPGRDVKVVQAQVRRIMGQLRTLHLIEPCMADANASTEWFDITPLAAELVETDSHREFIHGMKYVVQRWRPCVVMIYPTNRTEANIGSGFLVAPDRVATARHIPHELKAFEIATEDGTVLPHGRVWVPESCDIDIAVIELQKPVRSLQPMRLSESVEVLDDVVVMGYPPVARADGPYLLTHKGEVTAIVNRYDKNAADILISGQLRGGYSGGPVVNKRGHAVAVMAENLYRQIEEDHTDRNAALGIAAATRVSYVKDLLVGKGVEWQPDSG
jgi:V8-like Glu-specific endopeptidase